MLVEMELREIIRGREDRDATIILAEPRDEGRQFPFQIGLYEAEMLDVAVHKSVLERPFTHDLVLNVLRGMGGVLRRVIVDRSSENEKKTLVTYHAKLDVETPDRGAIWVDSRPSDAIVLATKLSVPIFVDEEVLRHAARDESSETEENEE